jgi:beta-fructofuranosidase
VTAETSAALAATHSRPRPRVHFTADDGWINDPYGVAWIEGRYHLYYQAIPGRVTWTPNCHWGHATSYDLIHWIEQSLVLTPQNFEVGCWSGSVVVDTDPPTIFYTRVGGEDWEIGQVATATLDRAHNTWQTGPGDVVIAAPPAELQLRSFRDPNVFRRRHDWALLMAAALPNGSGAVLQYTSADLRHWTYDGILCSRPADRRDALYTGALWECPQLFPIGDQWVLLISIWDEADLHYVVAGVGSYDGHTFEPASWQRLTYGWSAYATTAFVDRDRRRCLLSWLREEPRNNPALTERAGAHSVVSTLRLDPDGTVVLQPHHDVDALRAPPITGRSTGDRVRYDVGDAPVDVSAAATPGPWCEVVEQDRPRARMSYDPDRHSILVDRPDLPTHELPLPHGDTRVRALIDADIVEIFTAKTYGAYRIAPATEPSRTTLFLAVDAAVDAVIRPLTGA